MPSTAPAALTELYSEHVNPQWVKLLSLLEMNVRYERCSGSELFAEGRRYVDFLSGYCVHNAGHNHPQIVQALKDELDHSGPAMLQSHVPELAGELAAKLCDRAGSNLSKVFFCSSGSEGVEAAIKFSRAYTKRSGLLYAEASFHGLTCGALSLMSDGFWRNGFGPLLPETEEVPFGRLDALERKLETRRFAAFIVEPVQSEAGIRVPSLEYLRGAQALCRKSGSLFVLDEVQTGMYRTGRFLAAQHFGVEPDIVILAKALSGGLIPIGAVLMSDAVYGSVYDSLKRSIVHTSTFSENGLAMRAGLATLDVLDQQAGRRTEELGERLRRRLELELSEFEMVKEIRGAGLLSGIEFQAPRQLKLRLAFETFLRIHEGLFGQMLVMRLFREKGILTQICGNNFMVLKVAPPLVVTDEQIEHFVVSIRDVLKAVHSSGAFWSEALDLARRAVNI